MKKKSDFFRKCRIDPKNVKGGTLGRHFKIFEKIAQCRKIEGDPLVSSGFVGYVNKVENERLKGGPFALSFRWPDLVLVVSVKWTFQCEVCGLKRKRVTVRKL